MRASRAQLSQALGVARSLADERADKAAEFDELTRTYSTLHTEHQALLALHGEKLEEIDELRLDIDDLREMLRQQCESLAQQR